MFNRYLPSFVLLVSAGIVTACLFITGVPAQQSVAQSPAASGVVSGSIAATGQSVTIPLTQDQGTVGLSVAGTFSGSLTVRGSVDYGAVGAANATWGTTTVIPLQSSNQVAITGTGIFQINAAGFSAIQVLGTSLVSGQANIALRASPGTAGVMADNTFPSILTSLYPQGATPIQATSGVVGNAVATATLPGATNKTTYISGFQITADGATSGNCTAFSLSGATALSYVFCWPTGPAVQAVPLVVTFNPPVPATGLNTSIVLSLPAAGAGNTATAVNLTGFQQ